MAHRKSLLIAVLLAPLFIFAQQPPRPIEMQGGVLRYTTDARGNRVLDFSYAGYKSGEQDIPMAVARVSVPPIDGDATAHIQQALDYVASLPPDANGLRGAVLLSEGVYHVEGALHINVGGVVLRGSGVDKTTIVGAGTSRQTLITLAGKNDRQFSLSVKIADPHVPAGAKSFRVEAPSFKVGDHVQVHRPGTAEWIRALRTS